MSLNRYIYARDNPMKYVDINGHAAGHITYTDANWDLGPGGSVTTTSSYVNGQFTVTTVVESNGYTETYSTTFQSATTQSSTSTTTTWTTTASMSTTTSVTTPSGATTTNTEPTSTYSSVYTGTKPPPSPPSTTTTRCIVSPGSTGIPGPFVLAADAIPLIDEFPEVGNVLTIYQGIAKIVNTYADRTVLPDPLSPEPSPGCYDSPWNNYPPLYLPSYQP